jgi:hypothetical protein
MLLLGYNFFSDKNAIDPIAAYIPSTNGMQLENAIYNHMTVSNNGTEAYSTTPLTEWDTTTILNCNFAENVNAGNLDYTTSDLAGVKIKRREKGTFAWLTIYDVELDSVTGLVMTKYDVMNQNGVTYEYAFVPYLEDGTECAYIIEEVYSEFNGVFVCSANSIAKFFGQVSYDSAEVVNPTGIFEPLGSKYPIVVSNAITQYYKGKLSGVAMSFNQLMNDDFNRKQNTEYLNALKQFLSDKKAKIVKDWNGNLWLVLVTDNIGITYNDNVGMGLGNVTFNFVEIGDPLDQEALIQNGLVNVDFTPATNSIPSFTPRPSNPVDTGVTTVYDLSNIVFTYDPLTGNILADGDPIIDEILHFNVGATNGNLTLMELLETNGTFSLENNGDLIVEV